jgi:hypothetical protein
MGVEKDLLIVQIYDSTSGSILGAKQIIHLFARIEAVAKLSRVCPTLSGTSTNMRKLIVALMSRRKNGA